MTDISKVLKDIEKKFGTRIGTTSSIIEKVDGITTGNLAIDYITGVDGMPAGRIVELYGPPSSGKTTTALQTAAALQHKIIAEGLDKHILYLDFEQALDPDYCESLGLDVEHDSFLLGQPMYMEQGAEASLELLRTGRIALIICDSVAAMAPKALSEGDFDQRPAAMNRARLLNGWLLRLIGILQEHQCCAIFINHLMESVEMNSFSRGGPKESTPGGKGLKFYASMRIKFQQLGMVKGFVDDGLTAGENPAQVGTLTRVKVTKNKVGKPFREADVRVTYGAGFDNAWSALQVILNHKAIVKSGAWFTVKAQNLKHDEMPLRDGKIQFHGEPAILRFAAAHPEWAEILIDYAVFLLAEYEPGATMPEDIVESTTYE